MVDTSINLTLKIRKWAQEISKLLCLVGGHVRIHTQFMWL